LGGSILKRKDGEVQRTKTWAPYGSAHMCISSRLCKGPTENIVNGKKVLRGYRGVGTFRGAWGSSLCVGKRRGVSKKKGIYTRRNLRGKNSHVFEGVLEWGVAWVRQDLPARRKQERSDGFPAQGLCQKNMTKTPRLVWYHPWRRGRWQVN